MRWEERTVESGRGEYRVVRLKTRQPRVDQPTVCNTFIIVLSSSRCPSFQEVFTRSTKHSRLQSWQCLSQQGQSWQCLSQQGQSGQCLSQQGQSGQCLSQQAGVSTTRTTRKRPGPNVIRGEVACARPPSPVFSIGYIHLHVTEHSRGGARPSSSHVLLRSAPSHSQGLLPPSSRRAIFLRSGADTST